MNKKEATVCECPEEGSVPYERQWQYSEAEKSGMNHKPNQCKGTNNIKIYKRDNKILSLCSCCFVFGDIQITPEEKII